MNGTAGGLTGPGRRPLRAVAVPREARAFQGHRAGLISRLLAGGVDLLIIVVIVGAGYLAVSIVLFLWKPGAFHFPAPDRTWVLAAGASVLFVYLFACWVLTGRTWGDLLLGLRVVNYRGEPLRIAGAALRAAVCVVFPVGIFYVALSRANRSVADVLLRTSVIYDWGA